MAPSSLRRQPYCLWWRLLRPPARSRALALNLNGTILNPEANALPLVAAAAAADADGDAGASRHLLSLADSQQRRSPGYYGGAWDAFGATLLDTHLLNDC